MCQAYNALPKGKVALLDFERFQSCTKGQLAPWSTIQIGNAAEPTIHPRFADFLRLARSQSQAVIHVVTNGQLLPRHVPVLNEIGNCIVQVSADSLEEKNYERIRRGGSFKRLQHTLDLLDPVRTKVLISCTLMKSNLAEYESMVLYCRQHKFKMSVFPMILRQDRGSILPGLVDESLWFHLADLKQWLGRFDGNDFEGTVWGSGPGINLANVDAFSCNAHRQDLVVDSQGRATLCSQLPVGNILETSLEEVWKSATAEEFRARVERDRAPCKVCDYRERCLNPSFTRLENYFNREICDLLSPAAKHAIRYDRSLGDEEAKDIFTREMAQAEEGCRRAALVQLSKPLAAPQPGELAGAARRLLSRLYQGYLRGPRLLRRVLDPPVLLLRRVIRGEL
jgi:radical SAM protein with 4Fe4S-binding SPASM domain